jgi:glycine/D-amino acid oxidase-like deaminating enzyme
MEAQVIIVGGGLAGLSAAHTVLEKGGAVVLLDKMKFLGGNSTRATSGINGARTRGHCVRLARAAAAWVCYGGGGSCASRANAARKKTRSIASASHVGASSHAQASRLASRIAAFSARQRAEPARSLLFPRRLQAR